MKKIFVILFIVITKILFSQNVVINEVMSSNSETILDEFGNASDWIELYNNSTKEINLKNFFLSDDASDLKKWQFSDISIDANSYLLIFASDEDTLINYPHTNFKISASGENIIFSDSSENIIDSIFVLESIQDISYGRISDGNPEWMFQLPSPGAVNTGEEIINYSDSVTVNFPGGFYSSEITIELLAGESEIYYTLDGSDPDSTSAEYTVPININKTTVLKAISYRENYLESPILYQTYFINENTNLPIISLVTDPYNLFDADSGIYVHYEEDWERPAHIQFYDENKNLGFSESIGINIYGGYTRRFAQKSLAVKFKNKYGNNRLDYDLFPGFRLKKFKSFILRNSGNDFDQTHIRDAFMQTLIKDLDIEYLEYRPAVTYINGEYWGIYNIREKINEHYLASRHNVDPDNIDLMEGYSAYNDDIRDPDGEYEMWVGNLEAIHGDTLHYKQLIDYLNTEDLTTDAAYNFIDNMIDIENCLLYYAAHVYYNSQDWPANNSKYWRVRSPEGKWRWIVYDLDFGFNLYEWNNEGNSEDHVDYLFSGDPSQRPWSKPVESTFIPRKIVENPKIKNQFVNQVADLLNSNFKTDRVLNIMNNIKDHIANDINNHRNRFGIGGDYNSNINRMISFAQNRPSNLRNHVRNFFDSGLDGTITINSNSGGKIKINTIYLNQGDLTWNGTYYAGVPIEIKAIADEGYKFDGWSGAVNSSISAISLNVERTTILTASFSVDTSKSSVIVINEINYNSADEYDSGDWVEFYNRTENNIDLSGWYFSDEDDQHKFYFPNGTILNANEYLVLVENDSAFSTQFPVVQNYIGEIGFGFSGSGELLRLFNEENQIIDSLTYDDTSPWPIEPDGNGATLELMDVDSDNSIAENWKASDGNGTPGRINSGLVNFNELENMEIPNSYQLFQNYPNPFNPSTTIKFAVPKQSKVAIKIFDVLGNEIKTLYEGITNVGTHSISFNAGDLSSGVYFYKLQFGTSQFIKKLLLLK